MMGYACLYANKLAHERAGDAELEAAQFGESAQAADGRVARVGFFVEVVEHLVAVVGSEGQGNFLPLLKLHDLLHHCVHIVIAVEVVGFEEISFGVLAYVAEVEEVYAFADGPDHCGQVVLCGGAERAGAEADAVGGVVHAVEEILQVFERAHDAGQAEDGEGRIVGVDGQLHAAVGGGFADLLLEVAEVIAQGLRVDILVGLELFEHEGGCVLFFAGYAEEDDVGQGFELLFGIFLIAFFGLLEDGGGVRGLGAPSFEDVEVEHGEVGPVEVEGQRSVGHGQVEGSAGPVVHRHEVIGDDGYAAGGHVADGGLVFVDIGLVVAGAGLDAFVDGDAFHYGPAEAGRFHFVFAFIDLIGGPHVPVGYMVQGGNDGGSAGLSYIPEGYGVIGPEPAPGLFHHIHMLYYFAASKLKHF